MSQYRSNEDAFEIVCRIYYALKHENPHNVKGVNLSRLGILKFNLSIVATRKIMHNTITTMDCLRMKQIGGGFIRNNRVRERDPKHGRII